MISFRSIVIASLGVLSCVPVQAAQMSTTAQQGTVIAQLAYDKTVEPSGLTRHKNVRLKIQRAGQVAFDQLMPIDEYDRLAFGLYGSSEQEQGFLVRNLDRGSDPEVVVDVYTGGAHCCTYSMIYRYDSTKKQYVSVQHSWGNSGYRLEDLDRDGQVEFRSVDDRFAYAFTSYAASAYPMMIWRYRNGEMIDVTRQYPKLIYSHAYGLWQTYQEIKADGEVKGVLAAYLADKYLLGQAESGWKTVKAAYQAGDRDAFFRDLQKFLQEARYTQ